MVDSGNSPTSPSTFGEVHNLKALVEEVAASLRSQREILQKRGMNLPPGALQNLQAVETDLSRLEERLVTDQTELSQLRTLVETGALMNTSLDLDKVLGKAMDEVINLTDAERGFIILRDLDTGDLEYKVERDIELMRQPRPPGTPPQISNTILQDVLTSGEPLLADNAYKDPRMQANVSVAQMVLRSVLCVPLKYKDQINGAVYVDNRLRAGVFTERELNVLKAFANQAAVAIENARLYARIQKTLTEITEMRDVMESVIASIGSAVIAIDNLDHVQTVNPATETVLGFKPEALLGRHVGEVVRAEIKEQLDQVRNTGTPITADFEVDVPRGHLWLSAKFSPLRDVSQNITGVTVVIDDVTAQRERENRLDTAKRYLPKAMVDNIQQIAGLALGGERREVTCMFVEVRPYSTLPPDMRPADVMNLLNVYLSVATDVIQANAGIIDKYMGNELMVMFNTQLNPQDDHAYRAARMALELRDAFVKMYAEQGISPEPHYYRVGINTGIATLGNVGSQNRRDFTAIGDNINLSKRLEENAERGQIIISGEGRDHILRTHGGAGIRFEEREPIHVKGKSKPIQIYELFKA